MFPIAPDLLGTFVLTAGAIVLSPGPDTVLILRYALTSGRTAAWFTVIGVQIGLAVHTLLAVLGLSLLIARSPFMFQTIAIVGALYLAFLGFQGFRKSGAFQVGIDKPAVGPVKAMRDAILCNLLNPKVIVLFLALFPNFVDYSRDDSTLQLLCLAGVLVLINMIWQFPMAMAADQVRLWLKNPHTLKLLNMGTGTVLMVFAALMLWENVLEDYLLN